MSEAILGVMFVIIAVIVLALAAAAIVGPIYLQEEVATESGVVIEVNGTEYQDNGVTRGGNTTVVLLDNLWLSVTGLLGTIGGVLCGFWAFAAIAFGLAMLGLSK